MSWCQTKIAFLLEYPEYDKLIDVVSDTEDDHDIFDMLSPDNVTLPANWEFNGTELAGAAGIVLVFEIDGVPTELDKSNVESTLRFLENKLREG